MSQRRASLLWPVAVFFAFCNSIIAAPYIPASDDVVLAQLPAGSQQRQVQTLRKALTNDPANADTALALSRTWIDMGRRDGDPRFFSYAQATLAPWVQRTDPPVAALILMATSLQGLHRFTEAQALLDRVLYIDPRNPQAWLTKATLLQVRGDFVGARAACGRLPGIADQRVALACIASAQSMNGRLDASYQALARIVNGNAGMAAQTQGWLLGHLGEMATRLGDDAAAEQHFRSALQISPDDSYLKGELADLLLRQSRHAAVLELLRDDAAQDALLLRLAIAGRSINTAAGRRWISLYDARYQTARQRGDTLHLREQARYLLDVRNEPTSALQAAQRNWVVQREPADIRIYWRAAMAARSDSLQTIAGWIAQNRYQDATVPLAVAENGS